MKKLFLLAITTLALSACTNDDNYVDVPVSVQVSATIGDHSATRASGTSWAAGDRIGISSYIGTDSRPQINIQYTTLDGTPYFKGNPLYYYNGMVLKAYYPFSGEEGSAPGDTGIITVRTSAENQTAEEQPLIDFLWDSQTGMTVNNPNVNFTFDHKMSKLSFTFLSEDVDVSDIVAYEIEGLKLDGTFNTETGVCGIADEASAETLSLSLTKGSAADGVPLAPLIVLPQELGNGVALLRLYLDEVNDLNSLQTYTCTLDFDEGKLEAGCHYNYTITITKVGLSIGKMSIENWIEEDKGAVKAESD